MSMLFVIYMPVLEPEAFSAIDDSNVGTEVTESPKANRAVSLTMLYSRYVDQKRLARAGTENVVPTPQPDQPAPPPVLSSIKTTEKPVLKTLSGLMRTAVTKKHSATSTSEGTASKTLDSSPPKSQTSIMQKDENLNADDVPLIFQEKKESETLKKSVAESDDAGGEEDKHLTLRQVLVKILESEGIRNICWQMTENHDYWMVTFVADSETCDLALNSLVTFGFGRITGTSVSLFSSSFYSGVGQSISGQMKEVDVKKESDEKSDFSKSIKARLTVAQVLGAVKTNACITFDFLIMITAASFIAALGLAENSSVCLVASMLISPMMGPTIGITFGICIKSAELWKMSVKNECIGLAFCIGFGFIFGIITAVVNLNGAYWGSSDSWPTSEMTSRGMLRSLWVGVMTATLSGLGVALSILGGNFGSLVGVAISASILPPAVNAGVLWAHATIWSIHSPAYDYRRLAAGITFQKLNHSCPFLLKNEYQFTYSCKAQLEMLILGGVSILLTIINIVCIFLIAIAVLKIKEVAPNVNIISTKTPTDVFWRTDVPLVRNAKKKSREADLPRMAAQFLEEYKSLKTEAERRKLVQKWKRIFDSLENDPVYSETTQHLKNTMPEIFRILSQRTTGSISVSSLYRYETLPPSGHQKGTFDTIQGMASHVGNRLWSWVPFTESTETKPQGAERVPSRISSIRSFARTPSKSTITGRRQSRTANDDRSVSPVKEDP